MEWLPWPLTDYHGQYTFIDLLVLLDKIVGPTVEVSFWWNTAENRQSIAN